MSKLTEKERRIYYRLREVEPVKHGYGFRWRFRGSLEPVTRQIKNMERKGVIEVKIMAFGPAILIKGE